MNPYQITFETWNKVAEAYQEKFMDLHLYDDTYDAFLELVRKPEARLLELGCGPGNVTKYLLAKRPDLKILGLDVAPSMLQLARKNCPQATFEAMDCREISKLKGPFDAIICGFVFPYLSKEDVAKLIRDSADMLETGGIFYGSTIEGNYQQSGFEASSRGDKMYVYYHQEAFLKAVLEQEQFEILQVFRKNYPMGTGAAATHIILLARKK